MIVVTVAQVRRIAEQADREDATEDFKLMLDAPRAGDPAYLALTDCVVADAEDETLLFAVTRDGELRLDVP